MFNIALRGRENDPLSEFIVETVPRIFEFLSFREAAPLNDLKVQRNRNNHKEYPVLRNIPIPFTRIGIGF